MCAMAIRMLELDRPLFYRIRPVKFFAILYKYERKFDLFSQRIKDILRPAKILNINLKFHFLSSGIAHFGPLQDKT